MERNKKLAGRRIIVTGAASGMGTAIARLFAQHGARLALFDIDEDALRPIAEELSAVPFRVDVSDVASVTDAVDGAAAALGGLYGVVNVAGILLSKPIEEISAEEQDRTLKVNLGGPTNVIRASLRHMREAGIGTIVNFSSYSAVRPGTGLTMYGASKAGLLALAQSLIYEIGPNIRINSICPGVIETPMNQKRIDSGHLGDEAMKRINQLQRRGKPEELAEVALFLSCEESSFVSNAVIEASGGQLN